MSPRTQSFLAIIGAVGITAVAVLILTQSIPWDVSLPQTEDAPSDLVKTTTDTPQTASAQASVATTSETQTVNSKVKSEPINKEEIPAESATTSDTLEAKRIKNPYPFPPKTFLAVNEETRPALVNILCSARAGSLRPISASGVIIDPRGVILTNAHVAQYVLLASDRKIDLSCVIRVGSPARARFIPEILYIPPAWVREHAQELNTSRPLGTGAHDYALLRITGTTDGTPVPAIFPYLPLDVRENIGFTDDIVLVASYPAEFIGGMTAQLNLYPVSSVTAIKGLLTFSEEGTVDIVSLGGIIGAQSGSSGGAIVNGWGRLIGLISTTSEGKTTAERDLRAITLSYISRDISVQSGLDLQTILGGNVEAEASAFNASEAPALLELLIDQIKGTGR